MPEASKRSQRSQFLINAAYWGLILAIVYFLFKYFLNLVMPFFIAVILAALARPMARRMSKGGVTVKHRKKSVIVREKAALPYNVAAIISVIIVFLAVIGIVALIAIPLINFVAGFVAELPGFYNDVMMPALDELVTDLNDLPGRMGEPMATILEDVLPNMIGSLGSVITSVSGSVVVWLSSLATKLPNALLQALITLIATVFIALDYNLITGFLALNLSEKTQSVVIKVKDSLVDVVWKFLRSYFLIFLITMAEITAGLSLLHFNNAILLGIMIAIFDAFPIVGSGMILLPWSIITMIASDLWTGIWLFVLYLVVVIVRQIIEPKIVGRHVGLRPIVTLFCMYLGTKLFGGIGLFGLPIAAAIISDLNGRAFHIFNRPRTSEPDTDQTPAERELSNLLARFSKADKADADPEAIAEPAADSAKESGKNEP